MNKQKQIQSIMKKYFIFAAAALVALAACTKVETETPDKKISFNATSYVPQTKADPTTHHSLYSTEGVSSFMAKAFLHADGVSTTQNMFGTAGDEVKYNATNKEWAPDNEYFWPKSENSYINFVCWYSKNAKSQLVATDISETAMNWGTTSSPVQIVKDDNILFADEAWRYKDNVRNNATYGYDDVSEGVPTLFHHALARLAFDIKLKTTTASTKTIWDVEIMEATLKIGNNGYLPLTNSAPSGTAATTSPWKVDATDATSAIVGWKRPTTATLESIVETGSSATASGDIAVVNADFTKPNFTGFAPKSLTSDKFESSVEHFLAERTVMPQALGTTVKFALKFKIKLFHDTNNDGTKDGEAYSEEVITIAESNLATLVNTVTEWKMNTKVLYTITIDPVGKKVLFDPAVIDWCPTTDATQQIYPQS